MSPLTQTLIEESRKLVFEKVESECQGNSILTEFLPLLVNQDFKSDVKIKVYNFWE